MNKKQLYYALGGKKTRKALAKAEQEFLDTLPYDDGIAFNRGKVKKYDFAGWLDSNKGSITTGLSAANALLDGFKSIDSLKSYEDIKNQRANYNQAAMSNISDNNALMNAFNNISWANEDDYTNRMFGASRWEDAISEGITAGVNGVMATKSPWGLLAAVPSVGMNIFKGIRGKKQADIAKADVDNVNSSLARQFSTVANNVDMKNDRLALQAMMNDPFFALGGETRTHGSDFTNGLTFINEGGSHEENPNEGVQVGVDEEGTPNLVEEGESIWNNDYVFSKRLKVPTEISTKYKLGGDMSFADAVEKLTRESRVRPNDPISNATNNIILAELRDSQEQIRGKIQQEAAQKYAEAYNQDALLQSLAGMNGMMPPQEGGIEMQMPQQGQGMMPPGFALGGNLFVQGGPKRKRLDNGLYAVYNYGSDTAVHHYEDEDGTILGSDENRALILYNRRHGNEITPATVTAERTRRSSTKESPTEYTGTGDEGYAATQGYASDSAGQEKKRKEKKRNSSTEESYQGSPDETDLPDGITVVYSKGRNGTHGPAVDYITSDGLHMKTNRDKAVAHQNKVNASNGTQSQKETPTKTAPTKESSSVEEKSSVKDAVSRKAPVSRYEDRPQDSTAQGKDKEEWRTSTQTHAGSNNPEAPDFIGPLPPRGRRGGSGSMGTRSSKTTSSTSSNPDAALNDLISREIDARNSEVESSISKELEGLFNPVNNPKRAISIVPRADEKIPYEYRDESLRYAPVWGAALDALNGIVNTPDYRNADNIIDEARRLQTPINIPIETIGDYRRRNPFDEKYLVNMANANRAAALRSMDNTTGGNQGARLANVLNYFNQRDLGEVARQAYLANRADDAQVAEFNRGTNLQNMNAINQRNMAQAQLNSHRQAQGFQGIAHGLSLRQGIKDRWDANTGESLNTLYESLGNIGRENAEMNMTTSLAEHGVLPAWYANGRVHSFATHGTSPTQITINTPGAVASEAPSTKVAQTVETPAQRNAALLDSLLPYIEEDDYNRRNELLGYVQKLGGKKKSKKRRF